MEVSLNNISIVKTMFCLCFMEFIYEHQCRKWNSRTILDSMFRRSKLKRNTLDIPSDFIQVNLIASNENSKLNN